MLWVTLVIQSTRRVDGGSGRMGREVSPAGMNANVRPGGRSVEPERAHQGRSVAREQDFDVTRYAALGVISERSSQSAHCGSGVR